MTSTSDGFVVGDDGVIQKTTNGGTTWNPIANLPASFQCGSDPDDGYSIHFFQNSGAGAAAYSKGIIAADHNLVWLTSDGGNSWNSVALPGTGTGSNCPGFNPNANVEVWDIDFEDPTTYNSPGWAGGGIGFAKGFLYRTLDGGTSWTQSYCTQYLLPYPGSLGSSACGLTTIYGVAALGPSDPRAVSGGYGSELFVYQAGSANWDPCVTPCGTSGSPAACVGASTWVQKFTDTANVGLCVDSRPRFAAVTKISGTKACVGGRFGRLAVYDQNTGLLTDKATDWFLRIGDGDFSSSTHGCVIGQDFAIKRTTDGGATWTNPSVNWDYCPEPYEMGYGLDFSPSGANAVAVGQAAFIAISAGSPAGAVWTKVPATFVPTSATLNAVSYNTAVLMYPDEPSAWVVGDSGTVLTSPDHGATWTSRPVPVSVNLHGVSLAAGGGYVVGDNQTAYFSSDGGVTWSQVPVVGGSTSEALLDVITWGDSTQAIAVGSMGGVYEKTLARFVKLTLPTALATTDPLRDVDIVGDGNTVRICGDKGVVLFRDSGTWTRPWSQSNESLFRVVFQFPNFGFAIGRQSGIVKYQ